MTCSIKSKFYDIDILQLSDWLYADSCLSNWLHEVSALQFGDQVLEIHQKGETKQQT
jgi:hypothetical protein